MKDQKEKENKSLSAQLDEINTNIKEKLATIQSLKDKNDEIEKDIEEKKKLIPNNLIDI